MSTATKLEYLNETKSKIKNSINLTGANITNEDTFRSYADKLKQGLLDVLNKGNDYLYNNFPQLNDEGQNMSLTPTLEAPIKSELLGNTSQKTTTGKNLAEFGTTKDTSKYTYNSYSADNIDVEKTTTGGSFYASYILHIQSAGTYRFKGNILYDNQQFYIYSDRLYGNLVKTGSFSKGEIVYSWAVEEAGDYIIGLNGSTIRSYGVQDFMIIPSSITDDTYEPYTNGASPNPDYPQKVINATGEQVVKVSNGSQEQSYEINLGNIELCKIVDYQDRIYKDNGKWYLYKAIGKYTFTGNENWNVQATDNNFTTFQRPDILPSTAKATNFQQGLCKSNYFKPAITWNIWTNTNVGIDAYVKRILITIPSSIATTKTQLNQWLQEHNVYLDYVLATPTVEEITDSTLLNDLNNLENAKSYNGTTNITITAETPADLKITVLKNE